MKIRGLEQKIAKIELIRQIKVKGIRCKGSDVHIYKMERKNVENVTAWIRLSATAVQHSMSNKKYTYLVRVAETVNNCEAAWRWFKSETRKVDVDNIMYALSVAGVDGGSSAC